MNTPRYLFKIDRTGRFNKRVPLSKTQMFGQSPDKRRVVQLEHDDEAEANEQQAQVEEQHEATTAAGVGAHRVRRPHRLDHDPAALRRLGAQCGFLVMRRRPVRAVRSLAVQSAFSITSSLLNVAIKMYIT